MLVRAVNLTSKRRRCRYTKNTNNNRIKSDRQRLFSCKSTDAARLYNVWRRVNVWTCITSERGGPNARLWRRTAFVKIEIFSISNRLENLQKTVLQRHRKTEKTRRRTIAIKIGFVENVFWIAVYCTYRVVRIISRRTEEFRGEGYRSIV